MDKYTALCLNGGGIRGALHVGALRAFGTQQLHELFPDGVYGISIGAVVCALIAFEFTLDEISNMSRELRIESMIEEPRLQQFMEFGSRLGLDSGEKIRLYMKRIFEAKQLNLDTLLIKDASIPLNIIASDMTNCTVVTFCGTIRVWDALRASIALPLVFTPHTIKQRVFVDGAVLCKNILSVVPLRQRHHTLALVLNNYKQSNLQHASATQFMNHVLHAPSVSEILRMKARYPRNICVLTETATDILDFEPDIDSMLDVGESICRLFLSESTD
jgi:NTE family protein